MYNGYRNFETWACVNTLSNSENVYNLVVEEAQLSDSTKELASFIEDLFSEILFSDPIDCAFVSDILSAAFYEIDFREVAETFSEFIRSEDYES